MKKSPRKSVHRSGFETSIDNQLKLSGVSYAYESERLKYTKECTYTPDFVIDFGTHKIYIEVKGRFLSSDRSKHLRIKKEHPEKDIRFVFMRDNYLSKKSKTKYSEWATNNGFKWAIGEIPKEWLKKPRKPKKQEWRKFLD